MIVKEYKERNKLISKLYDAVDKCGIGSEESLALLLRISELLKLNGAALKASVQSESIKHTAVGDFSHLVPNGGHYVRF